MQIRRPKKLRLRKSCKSWQILANPYSLAAMVILTPKKRANSEFSDLRGYNIYTCKPGLCDLLRSSEGRLRFAAGFAGQQIRRQIFSRILGGRVFFPFSVFIVGDGRGCSYFLKGLTFCSCRMFLFLHTCVRSTLSCGLGLHATSICGSPYMRRFDLLDLPRW